MGMGNAVNKAQRFWSLIGKPQRAIMNTHVPRGSRHATEIRVNPITHIVVCTWVNDNHLHTITIDEKGSVIRSENV